MPQPRFQDATVFQDSGSVEYRESVGNDAVRVLKVFTDTSTPRVSLFIETSQKTRMPTAMFWPRMKRFVHHAISLRK